MWWLVSIVALTWLPLAVMLACYTLIFINFNKYKNKVRGRGESRNVGVVFRDFFNSGSGKICMILRAMTLDKQLLTCIAKVRICKLGLC